MGEFLLLSVALKAIELAEPPLGVYAVIGPAVIVWIVWTVARAVRRFEDTNGTLRLPDGAQKMRNHNRV